MLCLDDGLSKQDQIAGRVLGGSSRVELKYHTCWLTATQYRNEKNLQEKHGPASSHQLSTRWGPLSSLFSLLLSVVFSFSCLF